MATINEILDSENVKSNLKSWKNECLNFRNWYIRTGAHNISEEAMATAYIKIEAKTKNINNLYNLLS